MRYHYTPIRMAIQSKTLTPPNTGEDTEQEEFALTAGGNAKTTGKSLAVS